MTTDDTRMRAAFRDEYGEDPGGGPGDLAWDLWICKAMAFAAGYRAALADAQAAVALPPPDLWRHGAGFQGYTQKPSAGPWYEAETVRALLAAAPAASGAEQADALTLLKQAYGDDWRDALRDAVNGPADKRARAQEKK